MAASSNVNFTTILSTSKRWVAALKADPKLQVKVRTIVLFYLVGLSLLYVAYTLQIEPIKQEYQKQNAEHLALKNSTPEQITAVLTRELRKLEKQDDELRTKSSILQMQNELLKEMWQNVADEQVFFQIVLSLLPTAPTSLDQGMAKLNQMPPLERETFKIYPVSIDGQATFSELFNYIQYLENRPEVGLFDKFTLSAGKSGEPDPQLNFTIQVGRIQLEEETQ